MKKRVFAMLMACMMALSLVACGNKTTTTAAAVTVPTAPGQRPSSWAWWGR